jgi:hypothetical protein
LLQVRMQALPVRLCEARGQGPIATRRFVRAALGPLLLGKSVGFCFNGPIYLLLRTCVPVKASNGSAVAAAAMFGCLVRTKSHLWFWPRERRPPRPCVRIWAWYPVRRKPGCEIVLQLVIALVEMVPEELLMGRAPFFENGFKKPVSLCDTRRTIP